MSGPVLDNKQNDLSHSLPPAPSNGGVGKTKTTVVKREQLSFRTASLNKNLAQRLNKKKIEVRNLQNDKMKLKMKLTDYKRHIISLSNQKEELINALLTVNNEINARHIKTSGLLTRALEEMQKGSDIRATIEQAIGKDNAENNSYIANVSIVDIINKEKNNERPKKPQTFPVGFRKNKAVNMVRPMKYGFVVGNPVVSLRRLRRVALPTTAPLEVVTEDVDEVEEDDGMNDTVIEVEIAPTPSGLPSPSSPEAASTSATPEPSSSQTSPPVETRPSTSRRNQSSPRESEMFDSQEQNQSLEDLRENNGQPGFSPHMPYFVECKIAQSCKAAADSGHNIKTSDVQFAITALMQHEDYKHLIVPFKNGGPSRAWVSRFLLRHPEIKRNVTCSRGKSDEAQDSVKSKCPGPKSKKRKSLQVASAVARSLLIEKQSKKSSTPPSTSKNDRRATYSLPSARRTTNTPQTKPQVNTTFTISETQQIQLMTPCRVLVTNLSRNTSPREMQSLRSSSPAQSSAPKSSSVISPRDVQNVISPRERQTLRINPQEVQNVISPREVQTLRVSSPTRSISPRSPVVLLDRITTRKKYKSESQDSDNEDVELMSVGEIKSDDETLTASDTSNVPVLQVKDENLSPSLPLLRLTPAGIEDSPYFASYPRASRDVLQVEDMELTQCSRSPPITDKLAFQRKMVRNTNKILPSIGEDSMDQDKSSKKTEEIPQLRVKSPSKLLKSPSDKSVDSELSSENEEDERPNNDPDYVPEEEEEPPIEVKPKPIPKKYKPMPLSKKLLLRKQLETETSEDDEKVIKKKVAYENKNGHPDTLRESESQSSLASSDSDGSWASQDSTMSPVQRDQYMKDFYSRVRSEDPLEGTSKRYEPKKKAPVAANLLPCKKSLRQQKKKAAYVESPDTPQKSKEMDESWRPPNKRSKQKKKPKK